MSLAQYGASSLPNKFRIFPPCSECQRWASLQPWPSDYEFFIIWFVLVIIVKFYAHCRCCITIRSLFLTTPIVQLTQGAAVAIVKVSDHRMHELDSNSEGCMLFFSFLAVTLASSVPTNCLYLAPDFSNAFAKLNAFATLQGSNVLFDDVEEYNQWLACLAMPHAGECLLTWYEAISSCSFSCLLIFTIPFINAAVNYCFFGDEGRYSWMMT